MQENTLEKRVNMGRNKQEHFDSYNEGEKPLSDEGMMGVLHDHFMLTECDFFELSRSSFTTTAVGVGIHHSKTYTVGEKSSLESKKHFSKP